jgi:hypothetical protein
MRSNINSNLFFYLGILILSSLASCQNSKKIYLELEETIKYGPDTCYARGISIFNETIFTANSNGMVYSYNLKNKKVNVLISAENSKKMVELRDIFILDSNKILALQSNEQSGIYQINNKTINSWIPDSTFFDAFDFQTNGKGLLLADPKNDYLQVYLTSNFGENWTKIKQKELRVTPGEAAFAASGSVVQILNDSTYFIATGGMNSRILKTKNSGETWNSYDVPFANNESSGIFSMHFWDEKNGVCVGGNYTKPNDSIGTCFITNDGGETWIKPTKSPSGYRSCVIRANNMLFACGTNGIDYSSDNGLIWHKLSEKNTFALLYFENKLFATSLKGEILVFKVQKKPTK